VSEIDRVGSDEHRRTLSPNCGLVEWLRSCPEDGWFLEIEPESTGSLGAGVIIVDPATPPEPLQ
jgi:hypothetical protein